MEITAVRPSRKSSGAISTFAFSICLDPLVRFKISIFTEEFRSEISQQRVGFLLSVTVLKITEVLRGSSLPARRDPEPRIAKDANDIDSLVNDGREWISKEESRRHPKLDVDGEPMLKFRESMTPEFWRAPTDNDYGLLRPVSLVSLYS